MLPSPNGHMLHVQWIMHTLALNCGLMFILNSLFTHTFQGFVTDTGAVLWFLQCREATGENKDKLITGLPRIKYDS